MMKTTPVETQSHPSVDDRERMVEVRVLLPGDVVRRMDIYRTLVGQTRQAFVQLALQRHLELYSHLMLDLAPGGKGGVGIQIAGKDEPRRALPRRSAAGAGAEPASADAGDSADVTVPPAGADPAQGGDPPEGGAGGL